VAKDSVDAAGGLLGVTVDGVGVSGGLLGLTVG
jgi:hypothetical protein